MASSALRSKREHFHDPRSSSESAALRLTAAERPEEILPILLEEVVHLGFPSALVLELDFDTGVVRMDTAFAITQGLHGRQAEQLRQVPELAPKDIENWR